MGYAYSPSPWLWASYHGIIIEKVPTVMYDVSQDTVAGMSYILHLPPVTNVYPNQVHPYSLLTEFGSCIHPSFTIHHHIVSCLSALCHSTMYSCEKLKNGIKSSSPQQDACSLYLEKCKSYRRPEWNKGRDPKEALFFLYSVYC